jgi:hypothetical protein
VSTSFRAVLLQVEVARARSAVLDPSVEKEHCRTIDADLRRLRHPVTYVFVPAAGPRTPAPS